MLCCKELVTKNARHTTFMVVTILKNVCKLYAIQLS